MISEEKGGVKPKRTGALRLLLTAIFPSVDLSVFHLAADHMTGEGKEVMKLKSSRKLQLRLPVLLSSEKD